jgi:menaquinone-dependent protoporphyrinogen oxidase
MSRTLIAFGTRYGATAEVAQEIAGILQEIYHLEVDLVDLSSRDIKNLQLYNNIIVGSGIKMGRWTGKARRLLQQFHKKCPQGKKLAVFVCSGRAGEPDQYDFAIERYVRQVILRCLKTTKPVAYEAFGGRKPLPDHTFKDNRDWGKIREWAHHVGRIFSSD